MKPAAKGFIWGVVAVVGVLILFSIATPSLYKARMTSSERPGQIVPDVQNVDEYKTSGVPRSSGGRAAETLMPPSTVHAADRMIIRNAEMELAVEDVADSTHRISALAQLYGGYVEKSSLSGAEARSQNAEIVLRIPAAKLDEAREAVRKLAQHVDSDSVSAEDVTRQYVDLDARLRNARASEEQYLAILKKAEKIDDIVQVTEKIGEIRGQIEQMQGEMRLLSSQIEMSTLSVKLHPVAEAQVAGVYWHPWLNIKSAGRDLGQGLANFVDAVVYFVILLPLFALWVLTFGFAAWVVWRIGRAIWRRIARQRAAGFESPKS